MAHIRIRGARLHNLRAVDVDLPLGQLTVVTGVSGSGKSSLVFDTLHAEGRRRYLEALDAREGSLRRPPVDRIEGLPPTIALRQHTRAPSARQTVGDVTEIAPVLAVIFARAGVQHDPATGEAIVPTPLDRMVADLLELPDGTRVLVEAPLLPDPETPLPALFDEIRRAGFSRVRLHGKMWRLDEAPAGRPDPDLRVIVDRIRVSADRRPRIAEALRTAGSAGRGVIVVVLPDGERVYVDRPFSLSTGRTFPELTPGLFSVRGPGRCEVCDGARVVDDQPCAACGGSGLGEAARHVRLCGRTLQELSAWPAEQLHDWLGTVELPAIAPAVEELRARLAALIRLGLHEVPASRPAPSLSGGEWRRLRLARLIGQPLSGVVYILDEPTAGLAEEAVGPVLQVIEDLVADGNSVVAVSHREALVRRAHHLIELGPGAGVEGGELVYAGPVDELGGDSPTARWLGGALPRMAPAGSVRGAATVLHDVSMRGVGPLELTLQPGFLTVVHGPAGSGRTTVLDAIDALLGEAGGADGRVVQRGIIERVLHVDERRIGSARSMVATFAGGWDVLRELLAATTEAKIRGLDAGTFSLATKGGRCETCKGQGELKVDLGLLPPVWLPCEICEGRRFQEDVLDIRWKGRNAAALLDLTAAEAHPLLAGHPRLDRTLRSLVDVGLGYVPLGQSTADLSGGEAARLRLARELGRSLRGVEGAIVLIDEPTAGLHPEDALRLVRLLQDLAASGAAVVAASADERVLHAADAEVALPPPAAR